MAQVNQHKGVMNGLDATRSECEERILAKQFLPDQDLAGEYGVRGRIGLSEVLVLNDKRQENQDHLGAGCDAS